MKRSSLLGFVVCFLGMASIAYPQGLPIKSGATSDLATVNTNKAILTVAGIPTRATYTVGASALASTTANSISIEASAGTGFKLARVCIFVPNATASASVLVTVQRRTVAGTGGTTITNENTATPYISRHDPNDGTYGGIARLNATLGTAGAIVDSFGFWNAQTGASSPNGPFCKDYGQNGTKMPTVLAGVNNVLAISHSVVGTGGTALLTLSATIIAE